MIMCVSHKRNYHQFRQRCVAGVCVKSSLHLIAHQTTWNLNIMRNVVDVYGIILVLCDNPQDRPNIIGQMKQEQQINMTPSRRSHHIKTIITAVDFNPFLCTVSELACIIKLSSRCPNNYHYYASRSIFSHSNKYWYDQIEETTTIT